MRNAIQLMQRMNTLIVNGFDEVPALEQLVQAFIECGEVHDMQVFPCVYFPSFGVNLISKYVAAESRFQLRPYAHVMFATFPQTIHAYAREQFKFSTSVLTFVPCCSLIRCYNIISVQHFTGDPTLLQYILSSCNKEITCYLSECSSPSMMTRF
jgi:hypothetical protein